MRKKKRATQFAVIGLGRFGQSVVRHLSEYGVDILACDIREERLQAVAGYATHVAQADAGDEEAMAKLGLGNFDVVILAMGEDFQASLMATITAKELGAGYIVVKAFGEREKTIFERMGADLVVIPELEMGAKIAHRLVRPNILDIFEDQHHFQITEMRPQAEWVGKSVKDADIRRRYRTTILAIIREEETIVPVMPEEVLRDTDVLVMLCEAEKIDEKRGLPQQAPFCYINEVLYRHILAPENED